MIVLQIEFKNTGCLRYCSTNVGIKCSLNVSKGFDVYKLNYSRIYKDNSLTYLNFDINPGLIDFIKNTSLSLLMQNSLIFESKDWKSISIFITGLAWSLNPLARIWARYLLSFDKRATDSFALSPKFLIMTRMKSSKRDLEFLGSDRWSILLISTSAKLKLKKYAILSYLRRNFLLGLKCHKLCFNCHGKCCSFDHLWLLCLSFTMIF